jgi:hypothetical protein
MPVRRLVAQDDNDDNQWLKVDHSSRYIVNDMEDWQFLFGPNSALTNSAQVLKIAAQLDTSTLDKIRIIGYLYNSSSGSIDSASSINFKVYKVADITSPKWDDQLITTLTGVLQPNGYYFVDISVSLLTGTNLDGDTTLMIEATAIRSSTTYRDRIYVNHLGVYDSIIRLRNDVEFLDITKQDI